MLTDQWNELELRGAVEILNNAHAYLKGTLEFRGDELIDSLRILGVRFLELERQIKQLA